MPKIQLVLMCIHSGPSLNKNKQIVQMCYLFLTKKKLLSICYNILLL